MRQIQNEVYESFSPGAGILMGRECLPAQHCHNLKKVKEFYLGTTTMAQSKKIRKVLTNIKVPRNLEQKGNKGNCNYFYGQSLSRLGSAGTDRIIIILTIFRETML